MPTPAPKRGHRRVRRAGKSALSGTTQLGPKGVLELPRGSRRPEKTFRPACPRALDPNAKAGDHALGALLEPPDREGQGLRRSHGEGGGCARSVPLGFLLPELRDDRGGGPLRPLDRRRGASCAGENAGFSQEVLSTGSSASANSVPDLFLVIDGWRWRECWWTPNSYAFADSSLAAG